MNINKWLENSTQDRLSFYKSAVAAGKYQRTKRECLKFVSKLVEENRDADVFILSL